jgi:predicted N-acetyltransferase YhbS
VIAHDDVTATRRLEIRPLAAHGEAPETFAALARLFADAYPIMRLTSPEALAEYAERLRSGAAPGTANVVAERDGALVGAMRLYDYQMNVHGRDALAGGVGSVAVSLAHKRQGIARALIAWYLDHFRRRGATFAILHPFRLDFYRAMGFGYGTPVHRFRFAPSALRDGAARGTVRLLGPGDYDALCACYERVRATTHGLIVRHRAPTERALADTELRYIAVEHDGAVRGFMQTSVVNAPDDRLRNRDELLVRDLAYEDETYLAALLGYLRSQRDQFARIIVESQDPAFYLAASDPRDGSDEAVAPPATHRVATTGLGMMYRILDLEAAFASLPPSSRPFTLTVVADDPFVPAIGGTRTFRFGPGGAPQSVAAAGPPDATLTIGIADLASVVMGSLRLDDVVRLGLANLEPRAQLGLVDGAFRAARPPQCTTRF